MLNELNNDNNDEQPLIDDDDNNDDQSLSSTSSSILNNSSIHNSSISSIDDINEEAIQIVTHSQTDYLKDNDFHTKETIGSRRKRQNENVQLAMNSITKKPRIVSSLIVNNDMVEKLCKDKFSEYLRQKLHKNDKMICDIVKRLSQYLYHANSNRNTNSSDNTSYIQKLIDAISIPTSITAYIDFCMNEDGYQACSLTVRLDDISTFIHYVELYEINIPTNFFSARGTIKTYRTSLKKMQTHKEKFTKNPEAIIASRKFPVGGLQELQSLLNSDLSFFNTWCEKSRDNFPSQSTYKYLMGFILASLWVYSLMVVQEPWKFCL